MMYKGESVLFIFGKSAGDDPLPAQMPLEKKKMMHPPLIPDPHKNVALILVRIGAGEEYVFGLQDRYCQILRSR